LVSYSVTVAVTINGLVKLPCTTLLNSEECALSEKKKKKKLLMPISIHPNIQSLFETRNGSCGYYIVP